ncbi:unnamed protein product [Linum tenue]|uniref:Potassium transporter n=1 Tax=Linum tenue TaxID=586396 RepID=A0AAV0QJQ2_9ROSI|nr:unnamed protein product [Linum tenue]
MSGGEAIPDNPPADREPPSELESGRRLRRLPGHGGRHDLIKDGVGWGLTARLAFQSLGVVYGDIGTSPMYLYASTFSDGIKHDDDVLGVLSLILYTLTLIPLVKYGFVVLRATHNGEGGTFALYSLICKHARVGLQGQPTIEDEEDEEDEDQKNEVSKDAREMASRLKSKLEDSQFAKYALLVASMFCAAMVIGDGVLTPCISGVYKLINKASWFPSEEEETVVGISIVILIGLFAAQRLGTERVGSCFAPVMCVWFAINGGIGLYNLLKYDPSVVRALDPRYIVRYFSRNGKEAWISLGGVVLATTGSEAMFADVGHFSVRAVQLSMCVVVYPALVLAYLGQVAFLTKNPHLVADAFFKSIPGTLYWPVFVVAILASVIASQALISGTFSIVQQSHSMGCFPPVTIVHTSSKSPGQIYVPEVNWLLMVACVAVTVGFQTTAGICNAYGMAVVMVMVITTSFLVLIMVMIWKVNLLLVVSFVATIGTTELAYLTSVLYKFPQGGYLPLTFAGVLMLIMYTWSDVQRRRHHYELHHRISPDEDSIGAGATTHQSLSRLPGIAVFHSDGDPAPLHGIPPVFKHYVANIPALHSVVVLVSIRTVHVARVRVEERMTFSRVGPPEMRMYRCVARYGYEDGRRRSGESGHVAFEEMLVKVLMEFVRANAMGLELVEEIEVIQRAWDDGVVHLIGEYEMIAGEGSGFWKRLLVDWGYSLLGKIVWRRSGPRVFDLPCSRTVRVGMTYQL